MRKIIIINDHDGGNSGSGLPAEYRLETAKSRTARVLEVFSAYFIQQSINGALSNPKMAKIFNVSNAVMKNHCKALAVLEEINRKINIELNWSRKLGTTPHFGELFLAMSSSLGAEKWCYVFSSAVGAEVR